MMAGFCLFFFFIRNKILFLWVMFENDVIQSGAFIFHCRNLFSLQIWNPGICSGGL